MQGMKPCDCQSRGEFFAIHPDDLSGFLDGFVRQSDDQKAIYHLYKCRTCDAVWLVDDVTRGPMAVRYKGGSLADFDEKPYRRELCIEMHGGISTSKCAFEGCENLALKDRALCVEHVYPVYAS
jgi:hypothetical protein